MPKKLDALIGKRPLKDICRDLYSPEEAPYLFYPNSKGESGSDAYVPKPGDEKKFAAKHKTKRYPDRNKNDDKLFRATNIKDTRDSKHGYESPPHGLDKRQYEETEINELTGKGKLPAIKKHYKDEDAKLINRKKNFDKKATGVRMKIGSSDPMKRDPLQKTARAADQQGRDVLHRANFASWQAKRADKLMKKANVKESKDCTDLKNNTKEVKGLTAGSTTSDYGSNTAKAKARAKAKKETSLKNNSQPTNESWFTRRKDKTKAKLEGGKSKLAPAQKTSLKNNVKEEEQLDEIGPKVMKSYLQKSTGQASKHLRKADSYANKAVEKDAYKKDTRMNRLKHFIKHPGYVTPRVKTGDGSKEWAKYDDEHRKFRNRAQGQHRARTKMSQGWYDGDKHAYVGHNEETELDEKAVSKSQQRFFGMVDAMQSGRSDAGSEKVAKAAADMKPSDVKDFARTKHKGLPNRVEKTDKKNNVKEDVDPQVQAVYEALTTGSRRYMERARPGDREARRAQMADKSDPKATAKANMDSLSQTDPGVAKMMQADAKKKPRGRFYEEEEQFWEPNPIQPAPQPIVEEQPEEFWDAPGETLQPAATAAHDNVELPNQVFEEVREGSLEDIIRKSMGK